MPLQTVDDLLDEAQQALSAYGYYGQCQVLSRGTHSTKFRLIINKNLFIQVNRNEKADLTNFALVYRYRRIFGRDEYQGYWHQHTASAPEHHDSGPEGCRSVSLAEFLSEADRLLQAEGLI